MQNSTKPQGRIYLLILSILAWFTLVFQFYLHILSDAAPKAELIVRFFSYFTIDSNLLVALCSTAISIFPNSIAGRFFSKPSVTTAVSIYIIVVALVYNTVLRFLWVLTGWSMVLNELLHVIVPFMFFMYWIYFVPKQQLKWSDLWLWLIYPLAYTFFVMIRGSYVDFYPYPFLNVTKLGLGKVMLNCALVTLVFAFLSALFIAIGRRSAKKLGV